MHLFSYVLLFDRAGLCFAGKTAPETRLNNHRTVTADNNNNACGHGEDETLLTLHTSFHHQAMPVKGRRIRSGSTNDMNKKTDTSGM
jgi:hypothetical protein